MLCRAPGMQAPKGVHHRMRTSGQALRDPEVGFLARCSKGERRKIYTQLLPSPPTSLPSPPPEHLQGLLWFLKISLPLRKVFSTLRGLYHLQLNCTKQRLHNSCFTGVRPRWSPGKSENSGPCLQQGLAFRGSTSRKPA